MWLSLHRHETLETVEPHILQEFIDSACLLNIRVSNFDLGEVPAYEGVTHSNLFEIAVRFSGFHLFVALYYRENEEARHACPGILWVHRLAGLYMVGTR